MTLQWQHHGTTRCGIVSAGLIIMLSACEEGPPHNVRGDLTTWTPPAPSAELFPVNIVRPENAGTLKTDKRELSGAAAGVACVTCHRAGTTAAFATRPGTPAGYHKNVGISHGNLQCNSCHEKGSPDLLHRADGSTVPMQQAMELCSQCHGPQRRNYDHGAHGGKRGYWDRQRGPQERNDCVTCHTPHAPAYPKVTPVEGPRDRFANPRVGHGSLVEQRYGKKAH